MTNWLIKQTVDLQRGAADPYVVPDALLSDTNQLAHTWRIQVMDGGQPANLQDAAITGHFLRMDGVTVQCVGGVSRNTVSVVLTQPCYAVPGKLVGSVQMVKDGASVTLTTAILHVRTLVSGEVVNPGVSYSAFQIDASPAGTYANLSALNAASPAADVTKIYITLDDGKWNYHNGSEWVAGGLYQAASTTEETESRFKRLNTGSFTLTNGSQQGYYFNPATKQVLAGDPSYSCQHFTRADQLVGISVDVLKASIGCVFVLDDVGDIKSPPTSGVGEYTIIIPPEAAEVYVNFFGPTYWDEVVFESKIAVNQDFAVSGLSAIGHNLYDPDKAVEGYYYDATNGSKIGPNANTIASEMIPIGANEVFWLNQYYHHICYYDVFGKFISGALHEVVTPQSFTTPPGTAFVRVSGSKPYFDGLMMNTGAEALPYEPFVRLLDESITVQEIYEARGGYTSLNSRISALSGAASHFKEYEPGYIHFTVPVNQHIVDDSNTANAPIDNEANIEHVDCVLKLPATYSIGGKPTRLLMLCHGAGKAVYGTVNGQEPWIAHSGYNLLVSSLVSAGYAVFDCNGYDNTYAGCNFWGAQKGLEAWRKARDYIVRNYNVETDLSIYGFSMGGLTALNLVMQGFPGVKAVGVGSPVTNIDATTASNAGSSLLAAYGIVSYDQALLKGNDPIQSIISIGGVDYCPMTLPPLRVWFGATETWPAPSDAQRLVTAIKNAGGRASYRSVDGAGHEISYGVNAAVVIEIVAFFNRYNN